MVYQCGISTFKLARKLATKRWLYPVTRESITKSKFQSFLSPFSRNKICAKNRNFRYFLVPNSIEKSKETRFFLAKRINSIPFFKFNRVKSNFPSISDFKFEKNREMINRKRNQSYVKFWRKWEIWISEILHHAIPLCNQLFFSLACYFWKLWKIFGWKYHGWTF